MHLLTYVPPKHEPWNKGKITGQKPPLKLQEIWAIRVKLQLDKRIRDLALFNLAIDSKPRACDLVSLRVGDVFRGQRIVARTTVMQQKTHRPVQFEITQQARESLLAWIKHKDLRANDFLFPAAIERYPIYRPVNTIGWWSPGYRRSG
jgi:integrase